MKRTSKSAPLSALAVAALLAVAATSTNAQSWETILDLNQAGNIDSKVSVDPWSADPTLPNLFVAGYSGGGSVLLLGQTVPNTLNNFVSSDPAPGQTHVGWVPATGDLYSLGASVRRSSDQGATWQTADAFAYSSSGMAADAQGNIFVAGSAADSGGYLHWIIRKSSNRGATWTTLLDLSSRRQNCKPNGVCYVAGRGLFVVGRVADKWTVQRKRDTESSLTTVDTWTAVKNGASLATGIAADSQGNIFVCGATGTSSDPVAWVVRMSSDGGTKWTTILDRWYAGYTGIPEDMAIDSTTGDVWLAGYQRTSVSTPADWTVARLTRANNWGLAVETPLGGDGVSVGHATGIASDASGNLYVVGRFKDATGLQHWVVQRHLSAP